MATSHRASKKTLASLLVIGLVALPARADDMDRDLSRAHIDIAPIYTGQLLRTSSATSSFVAAKESGIASWYGRAFNGRPTASGEIFNADALTAAHPNLPLPSLVKVTNQANGREIVVRVNDRGPFTGGRIIDLSRRAAETLGMLEQGTATVTLDYIGPAPRKQTVQFDDSASFQPSVGPNAASALEQQKAKPTLYNDTLLGGVEPSLGVPDPGKRIATPAKLQEPRPLKPEVETQTAQQQPEPPIERGQASIRPYNVASDPTENSAMPLGPQVFIQIGAFTRIDNAEAVSERLRGQFETDIEAIRIENADYFRVFAGPFATRDAGETARQTLSTLGLGEGFLVLR
ncbi:septal ring lytic transglycosylase RlpA family protein [Henriciella marina]|uniref:septal ring lytic transglycosylase RlpA family protein n=1 Tax=Henriciella marina TaxID=453851 RepID=UPI00035F9722|nr:septal ring lytic transglycosylase RlpA family protein [Henriciella marina]